MREIKVRGYAVDEVVGSQWIIGTGVHTTEFTDEYAAETGKKYEHFVFGEYGWVEVHGGSIGQYTGLKDKNDCEIYEGNIIQFTNKIDEVYEEVGKVVWEQDECNFVAQYKTTNPITHKEYGTTNTIYLISNKTYKNDVEYEVIGNIYENPELLAGDTN